MSTTYTPEPGSLPDRVLQHFKRHPLEEFTDAELARKFNVTSSAKVPVLLAACLTFDLLTYKRDAGDPSKTWRVGPKFAAWQPGAAVAVPPRAAAPAAAPAASPAPSVGPAPTVPGLQAVFPGATPKKRGTPTPPDVTKLKVHVGLPLPPPTLPGRKSPWEQPWAALKVGDCAELPDKEAYSLINHLKKQKAPHDVRRLTPTTLGVWKSAAQKTGASA